MIVDAPHRGSSGRQAGAALLPRGILLCLLLLIPFVRGSALGDKACRAPFDTQALRRVKIVCVDTSYLEPDVASDVKAFVAKERRPGQILGRLSWEFADQCGTADAVIRVYFTSGTPRETRSSDFGGQGVSRSAYYEHVNQVVLLIYDRASVSVLYRTEDRGEERNRLVLMKGPFSRLAKVMKTVGH